MDFIDRWKNGENQVGRWLAETKTGTVVKSGIAPVLLWVGQSVADSSLLPVVQVAIVAVVPTIINIFNPADTRMGLKGKNAEPLGEE